MEPFSTKQLAVFFSDNYRHPDYKDSVDKALELRIHADGLYPEKALDERRPHESQMVRDYRRKIWKAITKPTFGKVMNSLAKIRRSSEWSVKFEEELPKTILPTESLEAYINSNLPTHTSLTNWAFSVLLREYCIDANAWVAVIPNRQDEGGVNLYMTPSPIVFRSEQIVDFGKDYLVVKSDEKTTYLDPGSKVEKEGDVYYIITDTYFEQYVQINSDRDFVLDWLYVHNLNIRMAVPMRGVVVKATESRTVSETRLAPMLPRLDEAVREYSDLQAEVVQHIYSEKWELGQKECTVCQGKCVVDDAPCNKCAGSGWEPRGPYTVLTVEKPMPGEIATPIPPAGYVQKNTEIVQVQDKRVDKHIYHALAAVNMEFLMQAPIDESGIAKAYDADETNNFVHTVAEDLVAMLDSVVFFISELRYHVVEPNAEKRLTFLPKINVPDQFDLFSAKMIEEGLKSAKESNVNPVILDALEEEYANKKFSNNPEVRAKISLVFQLDPLSNIPEADKVMMLQNGGVTKEAYVVSCNIRPFIARAVAEKGRDFLTAELAVQKEIIYGYAAEQLAAADVGRQIISEMTTG